MTKENQCQCANNIDQKECTDCQHENHHCQCSETNHECKCGSHEHDCQCNGHSKHDECCNHHHHDEDCGCEHSHEEEECGCGCHHDHFNDIEPDAGLTVQFSGVFEASIDEVWEMLTDNEKLKLWFPELHYESLQAGGKLIFTNSDNSTEEMMVLDFEAPTFLSFTWDINIVSFELQENELKQTELVFTEWISQVNDHSPIDLTGWMICLQTIAAILEGEEIGNREDKFDELYPKVRTMLEQRTNQDFE